MKDKAIAAGVVMFAFGIGAIFGITFLIFSFFTGLWI